MDGLIDGSFGGNIERTKRADCFQFVMFVVRRNDNRYDIQQQLCAVSKARTHTRTRARTLSNARRIHARLCIYLNAGLPAGILASDGGSFDTQGGTGSIRVYQ